MHFLRLARRSMDPPLRGLRKPPVLRDYPFPADRRHIRRISIPFSRQWSHPLCKEHWVAFQDTFRHTGDTLANSSFLCLILQRSAKVCAPGLVNFITAVANLSAPACLKHSRTWFTDFGRSLYTRNDLLNACKRLPITPSYRNASLALALC